MPKLLRVEEVAQLLDVSRARCYELVRRKLIPAIRVGRQIRVDPAQLEMWMNNGGQRLQNE